MSDSYEWQLEIKYDPDQPRVPAGQSGGGRWTSSSYGSTVSFGSPPGSATATTFPDGSIVIRKEDYQEMSPADKRAILAHEISHGTVEEYHQMHPEEWDASKRLLKRETVRRGIYEGLDAFYPYTINLGEAVAEALSAHLANAGQFSNMPTDQWLEFRKWASGLIERSGYSEDELKNAIEQAYEELERQLQ